MKIHILWAALAKKLIHFSQRRLSDVIFKYCKFTVFRLCPRFYKVTTRHHIFATPFHKAMKLKHENFRIYRGVSLEKIPGLGQFLQSKIAKIQIFCFLLMVYSIKMKIPNRLAFLMVSHQFFGF